MQIVLHTTPGQATPALTLPGDSLADALQGIDGPYLLMEGDNLPSEPRDAWIVDWDTGTVSVDPDWVASGPPAPDWDGLNAAILLDPDWQAATAIVRAINPGLTEALPAAMTQIGTGQAAMFAFLYDQICTIAEVALAQRDAWATMAEGFNLPAEFVDIVRGANGH